MRASWRRLVFFFVCIALGVGAITGLRSIIQSVHEGLAGQAKTLAAADITLQSNRAWTEETRRILQKRLSERGVLARTDAVELPTMVRPADESKPLARMVELRAVQAPFPLYGSILLEDGRPYSHDLLKNGGALVRTELLTQLELGVGDAITIGDATFTIRGVISLEAGRRLNAFSLGPRVLIDYDDMEKTGLLAFGSRANYQVLLKVNEADIEPLVQGLRSDLSNSFVSVRSYRGVEDQIGSQLTRAEDYLSLVGFVILIIGGIGVWSVTRVFVHQKMRSIAVLKCLGASASQILAIYVTQVLSLGVLGSLIGVVLAWLGILAIPASVASALAGVTYGLTASAVAQGFGIGVLVALLFALVPLLDIRRIKPLLLLRDETRSRVANAPLEPGGSVLTRGGWSRGVRAAIASTDWVKMGAAALVTMALVALCTWQAASLRIGLYVSAGFAGVIVVLALASAGLVRAIQPLTHARAFALRHAVLHLARPGNQTRLVLMAVGLGAFFILGVRAVQNNLLREFAVELRVDGPDMFLLDIQRDQETGLQTLLDAAHATRTRFIPVLRARVTGIQGQDVNLERYEDVRGRGSLGREYVITYRDHLDTNETLLEGRFSEGAVGSEPEVSIERSLKERFRIRVGDMMRFDVLGRAVSARVTSVREVDWGDSRNGGFMFVFRPDVFARAPHGFIGVLRGPAETTARARLQHDIVAKFPNVSSIDVREIIKTIEGVMSNVTLAISIVGLVALLGGVLILVGSVALTKFQRVYDAAVFRTLGATTRDLGVMLALEYGSLGALAGLIGSLGAIVLSWSITKYVLDIRWTAPVSETVVGIIICAIFVCVIGVLSSLDVLRQKPLLTLRAE